MLQGVIILCYIGVGIEYFIIIAKPKPSPGIAA